MSKRELNFIAAPVLMLILLLATASCSSEPQAQQSNMDVVQKSDYSLLVFSKTAGYRHASIEPGQEAITGLGQKYGFSVTFTEDSDYAASDEINNFNAILFLNTTGTLFTENQRSVIENYIRSGGGYAGVHSAADTEYDWPWYEGLVGAYFDNHPGNPNVRNAFVEVVNSDHPATTQLPEVWEREDEWYNYRSFNSDIQVLLKLDTHSYEGSDHPGNHPISWYREYDGGRSFYTGLGHTSESYTDSLFIEHLMGGILYAMGLSSTDELNP
jgi:type 1 glutamine amidotransferase